MTEVRVLAFDLSLTSTGICLPSGVTALATSGSRRGVERLAWIRDHIYDIADNWQPHLIAIEGYAFARPNQAHQVGELGGIIRLALTEAGHRWLTVAPKTVKKYAAGSGNASKDDVWMAAVRRLGYDGTSKDEADALWIRAAVLEAAGQPVVDMPAAHRAAVTATSRGTPSLVDQVQALLDLDAA